MIKLLEAYTVAQQFDQLYSLSYQDVPENLILYLGAFQDGFERRLIEQGFDENVLNHDLNSDIFWKLCELVCLDQVQNSFSIVFLSHWFC